MRTISVLLPPQRGGGNKPRGAIVSIAPLGMTIVNLLPCLGKRTVQIGQSIDSCRPLQGGECGGAQSPMGAIETIAPMGLYPSARFGAEENDHTQPIENSQRSCELFVR